MPCPKVPMFRFPIAAKLLQNTRRQTCSLLHACLQAPSGLHLRLHEGMSALVHATKLKDTYLNHGFCSR